LKFRLIIVLALAIGLIAGMLRSESLAQDDSESIYLFYLHGRIIEDEGPTPTHPRWGLYDYPAIVDALGSRGATVVTEVRASGTDSDAYARKTVRDIEKLVADGVTPNQIIVAGFSKGGGITIRVSDLLGRPEVRFVLLAACADWISTAPDLHLSGRVLSIYEETDEIGISCQFLADRDDDVVSFEEIKISTGKEHGAFYLPRSAWMTPLLDWVHGDGA